MNGGCERTQGNGPGETLLSQRTVCGWQDGQAMVSAGAGAHGAVRMEPPAHTNARYRMATLEHVTVEITLTSFHSRALTVMGCPRRQKEWEAQREEKPELGAASEGSVRRQVHATKK